MQTSELLSRSATKWERFRARSEWLKRGLSIRKGEKPRYFRSNMWGVRYGVYDLTQVVERRNTPEPPRRIETLTALWVVNRHAKRCRDAARVSYEKGLHGFAGTWKKRKEEAYDLKDQALHHAIAEGNLSLLGHHKFGCNYAEVWEGGGHRFHRPCETPEPEPTDVEDLGDEIKAKARGTEEPRLMDAMHTLREYLKGKPWVAVYEWPRREGGRVCYECGEVGHIARYCPNVDWDEDDDDEFAAGHGY